ncbi:MAG: LysR family transcriptional regulator [Alphaproteobacteria bacterium]|nr:MAG: LysR family transcriptional regulator [Alphaproteobacteria bacterium]
MDQFRALEVFISVAEEQSFAGAARKLGISSPSVTRIVSDLEQSLSALLFNRTTRIVTLTDVGTAYLSDAKRIVSEMEMANATASGAHRAPTGLLRVTASTLFGQHYISPIILEYLDMYPDVNVEGIFLERIVNLLEEGIDVAVRLGHLQDSSMIATKVGEVSWTICGCPEYFEKNGIPQTPDDLKDHKIIAVGPVPPYLEWRFADKKAVALKPRLVYSSVATSISAAESGWGLTRALSYQFSPSLRTGCLQTVLTEFQPDPIPINIVHMSGRRASAKVRAFIDLAVERLRADPFLN